MKSTNTTPKGSYRGKTMTTTSITNTIVTKGLTGAVWLSWQIGWSAQRLMEVAHAAEVKLGGAAERIAARRGIDMQDVLHPLDA